ncbi:MAG: hypothetical protein ACPGOY_07075 [Rhodospirillaceae bacterium]
MQLNLKDAALEYVRDHNAKNGGRGGVKALAEAIGYKRPTVSSYLNGGYPANTEKLEKALADYLFGGVDCPHLAARITDDACAGYRTAAMSQSDPDKLRHWLACQVCPKNEDLEPAHV